MGPLSGLKVVEFGGIGPGPFCAQMLSDMGAQIIRIERQNILKASADTKYNTWYRSRPTFILDITKPAIVETVLKLLEKADVSIEGFRPGVMERLGLGPEICFSRNPRLIYGRISGWGQEGPLSQAPGHDINYLALSGGLHAIGRSGERPVPPLNLVADLGGGGMLAAFGIMCAVFERQQSGKGQIVDTAMIDGCASLLNIFYSWWSAGTWHDQRERNPLDGAAHFYDTYETADGKHIALGAIEPQFYNKFLKLVGIDDPEFKDQMNRELWPKLKQRLCTLFLTQSREVWCRLLESAGVCFSPVLSFAEAVKHPHNVERKTFIEIDGVVQAAPAPRFSRTKPEIQGQPAAPVKFTDTALQEWGVNMDEIKELRALGLI